jgi:hypothetical protein
LETPLASPVPVAHFSKKREKWGTPVFFSANNLLTGVKPSRRRSRPPATRLTTPRKKWTPQSYSFCRPFRYDFQLMSPAHKPSSLLDTRVIYCCDNLDQLAKLPDNCIDLIYIDPPFNSNRNYEVFWGETKEKRSFDDRHASTQAYIDFMRPRCEQLARVLKVTGSFYYHCDWHASHYVKVMLDQIFAENNFQNEIVWKRTSAHNDPRKYGNIHDTILFYTGSKKDYTWNPQYTSYTKEYIDSEWQELPSGEFFKGENMLDPQKKMEEFDFKGTIARWRTNLDGMMALWNAPQTEVPNSHGRILLHQRRAPRNRRLFPPRAQGNRPIDRPRDP